MRKQIFKNSLLIGIIFIQTHLMAQDIIVLKNGDEINSKIFEVSQTEVKYKKFQNLDGPTYSILKNEVLMIKYVNGSKDVFSDDKENFSDSKSIEELKLKGKQDAEINYSGRNSGAGWTAATTILFSPLIGAIPAAVCSSTMPNESNLNFKNAELMQQYPYSSSYKEEAHKIKKRKVWKNFGIGSGVWVVLILLL